MRSELAAAAEERLALILAARERLVDFARFTMPGYIVAPHHSRIGNALESVCEGRTKRLLICMPPRHGKSELASVRFPAWLMGRFPHKQIIASSYTHDLARDFGRKVRNLIASPEGRFVFPGCVIAADSRATDMFHTTEGGSYVAAGPGGAITGRGADVFLIDDPLRGREDADSELMRRKLWDWYREVAYTRLMPGGAIVLIQTRWHEDDLAGKILEDGAEEWNQLILPAISAEGEALWLERYSLEDLDRIRRVLGPRSWSALYQQRPAPEDGIFFRGDWLHDYINPPATLRTFGASDYAVVEDGGDYTVHIVAGIDASERIWILDLWRGQTSSELWVESLCDMVARWRPIEWAEESGQILSAMGPAIARRLRERRLYVHRRQFASKHDKSVRAQSIRARMALKGIMIPGAKPWAADLRSELLKFPTGKHDDQVDALALLGQLIDRIFPPAIETIAGHGEIIVREQPVYGADDHLMKVRPRMRDRMRRQDG